MQNVMIQSRAKIFVAENEEEEGKISAIFFSDLRLGQSS